MTVGGRRRSLRAQAPLGWLGGLLVAVLPIPSFRAAHANGAFPDSQTVLVPVDRPELTVLATNFGLVLSADGGQSWQWSCEQDLNAFGQFPQMGPGRAGRLFMLASGLVVRSDDGSCSWQRASLGALATTVTDFFVDPTDGSRVVALATGGGYDLVLASSDGGASFANLLATLPAGQQATGIEIARSHRQRLYVALTTAETEPLLAVSDDGGTTFDTRALGAALGPGIVRIFAVDPSDAETVYLRWLGADTQALAVSHDGGRTAEVALALPSGSTFTSFLRAQDGSLFLGGSRQGTNPFLYRSRDGGRTFEALPRAPHLRALAERGTHLYAATDNFADGYALGQSDDGGATWSALLSFDQVQSVLGCLQGAGTCAAICETEAALSLWPESTCTAQASPPDGPREAGAAPNDGGDAPPEGHAWDGAVDADASAAAHTPQASSGCGCGFSDAPPADAWGDGPGWAGLAGLPGWTMALLLAIATSRRHHPS